MKKQLYINSKYLKTFLFMIIDAIIIFASFSLGFLVELHELKMFSFIFILGTIIFKIILSYIFSAYKTLVTNFGINDVVRFATLIILENILVSLVYSFLPNAEKMNPLIFVLITSLEMILIIGSRVIKRITHFYSIATSNEKNIKTLIVGAGAAGKIAFDEIQTNPLLKNHVVGFVDRDLNKIGKKLLGKPILGPVENIKEFIEKHDIKEVIIAIANISPNDLQRIINVLSKENVKIKRLPILTEMEFNKSYKIKDVSLSELLGREQITFDNKQIKEFITNKKVLVTGAGGSIGSELVRQIYSFNPKEIILFDIYENSTYDIQQELVRKIKFDNSDVKLVTIIGSTYNEFRVEEIFNKYRPELVFHAAAYKHVPLMEDSPVEAIRTNCLGTYNVAKMCDKYKVEKMVLVSTDKAVRPTNTMGATKAFAEMVIRYWDSKSEHTSYSAVRFGNVLGSNGSVIPLFKKQIEAGGPVTVTHPDIVRYFMTIPEAVSLILQSGAFATGGEIFILDMGEPVKIVTLAENLIKQCGYVPYKDIKIEFVGLRHGEKLFEELLIDKTKNIKTSNDKIYVEEKGEIYPMDKNMQYISQVFYMTDNAEIKKCLREIVTNYTNYKEFNEHSKEEREKVGV